MEIEKILSKIYDFSKITLTLYKNRRRFVCFSDNEIIPDLAHKAIIFNDGDRYHSSIKAVKDYILCAMLKVDDTNMQISIGPVIPYKADSENIKEIGKLLKVPSNELGTFENKFSSLPLLSISRFRAFVKALDYLINGNENTEPEILGKVNTKVMSTKLKDSSYVEHFSKEFQDEVLSLVKYGKVKELEIKINEIFKSEKREEGEFPVLSKGIIESAKLIFTNALSLTARYAVEGGLPFDVANSMKGYYLSQVDSIKSKKIFGELFIQMFFDFAKKVKTMTSIKSSSGIVSKVNREIYSYLYEKISPSIIADNLSLNVSYICREFKKHTDKTIAGYINEVKIIEAKRLLETSEMRVIEIANQLGYSSKSYFYRVFKSIVGKTPLDYREHMQ